MAVLPTEFADDPKDKTEDDAHNNTSDDRKIKPGISVLIFYISGKVTEPIEFISEKINDDAEHNDHYSGNDEVFSKLRHGAKLYPNFINTSE